MVERRFSKIFKTKHWKVVKKKEKEKEREGKTGELIT